MEIRPATWHLGPPEVDELMALVAHLESTTSAPPLSDQSRLALRDSADTSGSVAVVRAYESDGLVAFAQVSPSSGGWTLDVVSGRNEPIEPSLLHEMVSSMVQILADAGHTNGSLTWWRDGGADAPPGFELDRELLQMRRGLPTDQTVTIVTRSFVPGVDEVAFVEVNNRAFVHHHEQSGWTTEMVVAREREPWFDPEGFRLYEITGRLAGFCWTKVHPADAYGPAGPTPAIGEIYVIAVDPDFAGQGLGKQLTLAGLDHLARTGLTTAMLYVDADNVSAVALYRRLGFGVHSSTKAYTRRLADDRE